MNKMRLATDVELIIIMMRQRGDLLFLLSAAPSLSMKLTMGTSVIDGNLPRMMPDFTFIVLISLNMTLI